MKSIAPYGSWSSPISSDYVAGKTPKISETCVSGNRVFWLEHLANEKGRATITMAIDGQQRAILPRPLSAKSKVHEYGGGAYLVQGNDLYFVLADDQRIYKMPIPEVLNSSEKGEDYKEGNHAEVCALEALTLEHYTAADGSQGSLRFASLTLDAARNRLIAVGEYHRHESDLTSPSDGAPLNFLVAIPLDGCLQVDVLHQQHDFYSNPTLSPDGTQLCWLTWDHPNMPWDHSQLWVASIDSDGGLTTPSLIAGADPESVFQPQWAANGDLYYVSDRSNWWNLYCCRPAESDTEHHSVLDMEGEFATPQWVFGMSTYGFLDERTIVATYTQNGLWYLAAIDLDSGRAQTIKQSNTFIESVNATGTHIAAFIGASSDTNPGVFTVKRQSDGFAVECLWQQASGIEKDFISSPQPISFPTGDSDTAYGIFYPPTHRDYYSENEKPPLIIICHGGPTGACNSSLNFKIQYWTSRGFAVADINYRGSTGYGRLYRQSLHSRWGVADVEDLCSVVDYLDQQKLADKERCIVKGSSAGGYSVLAALAFRETFKAGVSLYGIGDLELLAKDTHKFEARYLDKLVGEYPQEAALYRERSPIHSVDKIDCPMLILQGLQDKVVPPNQAETLVNAAKNKGLTVGYITYKDEGHGFRESATIKHMLEAELYFYSRVFGLDNTFRSAPVAL